MPSLAGSFLVARPVLQDPNFRQTVILLLRHDDDGAFGLVVNRAGKTADLPFPVYKGGPCPADGLLLLHGHDEWVGDDEDDDSSVTVAPGVYVGDATCLEKAGHAAAAKDRRVRFYAGYAGWGPDQLERELTEKVWAVVPASGDLLFDGPVKKMWERLVPPTHPAPSLN